MNLIADAPARVADSTRERESPTPRPPAQLLCGPLVRPLASAGALLALTVAVFFPHLFLHWSFPWDFQGKFTASPAYVASTIGRGHWTEWVPFEGGGTSIAVDLQTGLYYPLWWLLGGLHVPLTLRVLTAIQVAHIWFGAVGVLALARARGLQWRWALVAAVPFVFFGGFYGNGEHADLVRGFAYLPWLLWLLTPPRRTGTWARTAVLPLFVWIIATGAYPGLVVAFGIVGATYAVAELASRRSKLDRWRHLLPLGLAVAASALVVVAVFLPYVLADHAGVLVRPNPVTFDARAGESFHLVDALGLYLNDFAWDAEGTGPAWAVGIPVLVGLAGLRRRHLREHIPIVSAALVALLLGTAAQWHPVGDLMLRISVLFPTRFPDNDYKAMVAIALVILSALGWRTLSEHRNRQGWIAPAAVGAALVVGVLIAPRSTSFAPTLLPVLPILLAAVAVVIAIVVARVAPRVAVGLLLALIVVDGGRMVADWPKFPLGPRPWATPPSTLADAVPRDEGARQLPAILANPPARRPARPNLPFIPSGYNGDTNGFLGLAYELGDYGGTVYRARWKAETDPMLHALMLLPWTAWTFPCGSVRCEGSSVALPSPDTWTPDPGVKTTRFGTSSISYDVDLSAPAVMVENELDIAGWSADRPDVRRVDVGGALRGWLLPAGRYSFVASFRQPERPAQEVLTAGALLVWAGCGAALLLARRRRADGVPP